MVCADALHILFDFCVAKMAESKDLESLDSDRFALTRPLIVFGKALLRFFEVVDCVNVPDSESKLLKLESKLSLDSKSA